MRTNRQTSALELRLNPIIISSHDTDLIEHELKKISPSRQGFKIMSAKSRFIIMKLHNLSRIECNLIKQSMLSCGADACINKYILSEQIARSNAILFATDTQFKRFCQSLERQSWDLPLIARLIRDTIERYLSTHLKICYPGGCFDLSKKILIMGVLNVTPDSFYNGGRFISKEEAIKHAMRMVDEGAHIIDVGGESTRPGATPVKEKEELKRVIPVIKELAKKDIFCSIDTYKTNVARRAIEEGAKLINNIMGLRGDQNLFKIAAKYKVPVVIMHIRGKPRTMQVNPVYNDLISEMILWLRKVVNVVKASGVMDDRIIIDPGIGFGKLPLHNLEIIKRISDFKSMGYPILVGPSRKSFIGFYLDNKPASERLYGTLASIAILVSKGANIIRVHDVKEANDAVRISKSITRCWKNS